MARRHEQAVAVRSAETKIGATLRQRDETDPLAGRIEHHHAVERRTHAPAGPDVAVDVAAEAIRRLVRLASDPWPLVGKLGAVHHVEQMDDARARAAIDDIELALIGGE